MPKSKSLPWKVAPKAYPLVDVGSEEYGVLELPRKNSLTINEAQFIRDNTKDLPDVQQRAIQLAADIAKREDISFVSAFEALTGGQSQFDVSVTESVKKGDSEIFVKPLSQSVKKGSVVSGDDVSEEVVVVEDAPKGSKVLVVEGIDGIIKPDSKLTVTLPSTIAQENTILLMQFQQESAETKPLRNAVLATAMLRRVMGNSWTIDQTSEEVPMPLIEDLAVFCGKEMNGWDDEDEPEPLTEEALKND